MTLTLILAPLPFPTFHNDHHSCVGYAHYMDEYDDSDSDDYDHDHDYDHDDDYDQDDGDLTLL